MYVLSQTNVFTKNTITVIFGATKSNERSPRHRGQQCGQSVGGRARVYLRKNKSAFVLEYVFDFRGMYKVCVLSLMCVSLLTDTVASVVYVCR